VLLAEQAQEQTDRLPDRAQDGCIEEPKKASLLSQRLFKNGQLVTAAADSNR
jgi:hypothetical protein